MRRGGLTLTWISIVSDGNKIAGRLARAKSRPFQAVSRGGVKSRGPVENPPTEHRQAILGFSPLDKARIPETERHNSTGQNPDPKSSRSRSSAEWSGACRPVDQAQNARWRGDRRL